MIGHDVPDSAPATAEEARLEEIAALRLTAPDAGEALQAFAERAAMRLGTEVGLVTIVLDQAQYFVGAHGLTGWMAEARGTPVEWSFCAHAVRSRLPFIVEDTEQNRRVCCCIPLAMRRAWVKWRGRG